MTNVLMVTKYKKQSLPFRKVLYYIITYNINIIIDTRGKLLYYYVHILVKKKLHQHQI